MPDPPATLEPNPSQPDTPDPLSSQSDLASASSSPQPQWSIPLFPTITVKATSNAPALASVPPPPPPAAPMVSYAPTLVSGGAVVPTVAASFRPVLQFLPMSNPGLTNPNYQNPVGVLPPGVSMAVCGGFGTAQMSVPQPMLPYQFSPGQPSRPYPPPMPNGYPAVPQGTVPPFGLSRYPSPYIPMVHPPFPPRPPGVINVLPAVSRPQIPGVPGFPHPIIPPVVMSIIPTVTPAEKPQTIVYVGKIASIVENDFILSLLQLCGPVKSWKRAQDPTDGTPKGFGFCEFDSAEGVLRALRLLSKFNIDGQELVLNVNQATKEYLERYVDKQTENLKKIKDAQAAEPKKGEETAVIVRENETMKSSVEDSNKEENGLGKKENNDFSSFGIVTNEDKEADQVALDKLTSMTEERLKTRPLPPPPPPPQSIGVGSGNLNSDLPAKSRDGDSEMRNNAAEDKNDDEITSETKLASEHDRPERSSPDRSKRFDRRSRDRDRGRDLKREKEWEIERYERETERERVRKEREQRKKIEEAERQYEECLKEWEYREREREKQQYEREREKEREYKRKEIKIDEDDDDGDSRRRWHRNMLEDKRRRRLREKEDDLTDRNKEEEAITEAKKRADEHQEKVQRDALKVLSKNVTNESNVMKKIEKTELAVASSTEINDKLDNILEEVYEGASACKSHIGEAIVQNSTGEESTILLIAASDTRHAGNAPAKKLGFGLVGSGKRTAVPSVFHEDDDDARKEKRMRPLVPIDYSTEELEAVHPTVPGALSPNLAAAAEFAKRISNVNPKVDKLDVERERSRHFHHKLSQRDRDRGDENLKNRTRDDNKGKILDREQGLDKVKTQDNKKLTSLKQLIDMIPRTKEELFSHEINWAVYEKHKLHERMRPWISKKITEFLGEEETTLVDYIVSSTQEHVKASQMLELLQSILDDEAEMFVLKMWRMLIYEIKRVEADLTLK